MKLLLVDGSNIVMRCAFGGDIAPRQSVPAAAGMIRRCARQQGATHLVVVLDCPGAVPSWRKAAYPEYKAQRVVDTTPWLVAAWEEWSRLGWYVENQAGYEADDLIATVAHRAPMRRTVLVLSSDSDLLCLTAIDALILRPQNGGTFLAAGPEYVRKKYGVGPEQLTDFKALTGESGDNIPGVPGIGPVKAARLLAQYQTLAGVIAAGIEGKCKDSARVAESRLVAERARQLVALRTDAPIPPIQPKACELQEEAK